MKARQERGAAASRRLQAEVDAFRQAVNTAKAARAAAEEEEEEEEAARSTCAEMRNARPQGAGT